MTVDIAGICARAWHVARRDMAILWPVAGVFLFLPALAMLLLVPQPPVGPGGDASQAQVREFLTLFSAWIVANAPLFVLGALVSLMGSATIYCLYLDRSVRDVGGALAAALRLLPRFVLASVLVLIPAMIGASFFLLPGLYVLGRLSIVGPVLVGVRPVSAVEAVLRALRLSRGHGLLLSGVVLLLLAGGQLLPWPFLAMLDAVEQTRTASPVVVVVLSGLAAALSAVVALATVMIRIGLYEQLNAR